MDHSGPFLFSELFCGTPPSCFKVRGGWVVVVVVGALQDFSVSPSPLLGFLGFRDLRGLLGFLGFGGWGLGLDNSFEMHVFWVETRRTRRKTLIQVRKSYREVNF